MSDFLPTQPPGPGPTDAPLPTYQSYSAYVTSTYDYVTTITRIAYDPEGTLAPSLNIQTLNDKTTSIGYSVVNIPLLYDGPLPPPPLGTLYTTANQRIAPSPTNQPSNGNGNGSGSNSGGNSGTGSQGSNNGGGAGNGSNNGGGAGSGSNNGGGTGNGSNNGAGTGNGSNNGGSGGSNNSNGVNNGQGSGSGSNGSNSGTNNGAGTGSGSGNTNGQNGGTNNGNNQAGGQGANNGSGSTGNGSGSNNGNNGGTDNGTNNGSGTNGNEGGADNGTNNGSGANGNGGGADNGSGANGNGSNTGAGSGGGASSGTGGSPTVTTNPPNETIDPAALSSSASLASVSANNAASSASAASVAASNAAESSSASLASLSAASVASSASLESVSASSLSATPPPSGTSSSIQPTDSNSNGGGFPGANTPNSNLAKNGLSGGQIAGIVIGVIAAVLLALLLCLCCARRRRRKQNEESASLTGGTMPFGRRMKRRVSDRWANGWSRGGPGSQGGPGTYRALGAGAGAGAGVAGAAAAGAGRGSLRSDEWEEDHLDGGDGSGFFVVGGNRATSQNPFSHQDDNDDDEMREYGNAAPSSNNNNKNGLGKAAGLAGLGAGLAAAFGAGKRRRSSGKGKEIDHSPLPTSQDEADLADNHANQQDNDAERRGLMQNVDADMTADMTGDQSEMQQSGPSGWTRTPYQPESTSGLGTAAVLGAGAAGAYAAGKRRKSVKEEQSGDEMSSVAGAAPVSTVSNAQRSSVTGLNTTSESGVGSAYGSGSGSGTNPSSNSTGQRTSNSTFTGGSGYGHGSPALIPPPSAPRGERQMYTFGNLPPRYSASEQQQQSGKSDRIPSFTGGFGDGDLGMFGHRSAADSYQDMDDNERNLALAAAAAAAAAGGGAGLSALASHHRDSNQGTPYLGAGAGNDEHYSRFISRDTPLLGPGATHADITTSEKNEKDDSPSDSIGNHGRLPTIHSVGEFGERSNDAPNSTFNQSSQSGTNTTKSGYGSGGKGQFYSPALPQTSQSMNSLGAVTAEEGFDNNNQDPFSNEAAVNTTYEDEETAAGALAGAGLLGTLASGWRKLTGNTPNHPSSSAAAETTTTGENVENSVVGETSMQRGISRDSASADVHHRDPRAQRMLGDPDFAAEVQSQRASVQHANGSNQGHQSPIIRSGDGKSPSSSAKSGKGSGSGSGGSGAETRPQTLAEEVEEEDLQGETSSPYVDDGNDADDEDAIGDRSKASIGAGVAAAVGAGAGTLALGKATKGKQSSQAKSSSDDPYDQASTTNESSMLAVRNPTTEEERNSRPSMETGLSRAATTGTYSSNQQSEESSSRRTQQSSSGASTGAASYSPSYLARHPSGSTRGGGGGGAGSSSMSSRGARGGGTSSSRRQGTNDESEYTTSSNSGRQQRRETSTIDSGDGRSSMATAGGMADENQRNSREPGSLARVQEDEDTTGYDLDDGQIPSTSYYPSESLGAAVRRRAEQEARQEAEAEAAQKYGSGESDQTGTSPQQQLSSISTTPRAIPLSLRPGGGESSQWRQSPRVDAVSQRAARNAASMERQHHRSQSGSGSTMAATSPREESSQPQPQQQQGQEGQDDTDEGNRRTTWPKFLRF